MAAYREDGAAARRELEALLRQVEREVLLRQVEREAMVAERQLARWGPAPALACHTAPKEAVSAARTWSPHAALEVTASGTEIKRPRTTPEKPAAGVPLIPRPRAAGGGRRSGYVGCDDSEGSCLHAPCSGTQVGGEASVPCPCT